jgi:hypothetical protein
MTPAETRELQAKLRAILKDAVARGFIKDFALRSGGRATIYHVEDATKSYTTGTLDTMTHLRRCGWDPSEFDGGEA